MVPQCGSYFCFSTHVSNDVLARFFLSFKDSAMQSVIPQRGCGSQKTDHEKSWSESASRIQSSLSEVAFGVDREEPFPRALCVTPQVEE